MIHVATTNKPLSESQENYLKQIYLLTEQGVSAATQDLAADLGVAPASVTVMVQKLQELGLVTYEPYRGALLSGQGKIVAIELIRHHRLLESFLEKALGYGWEEVHDEADRLEHYISETFENKIAEWLGHPEFDPHGDPIPDAQLRFPSGARCDCLATLHPGAKGVLSRVATQDRDELNLFKQLLLVPGAVIEVLETSGDSLRLRTGESSATQKNRFLIPLSLAQRLFLVRENV